MPKVSFKATGIENSHIQLDNFSQLIIKLFQLEEQFLDNSQTYPQLCLPVKINNATSRIKPEGVNLAVFKQTNFLNNCKAWQSEVMVCQGELVVHRLDFAFFCSAGEKRNVTPRCVVRD
ncbi:hypothetical protein BTVI_106857 [Pitangus sulphuratus]|nr:hypothetical protein BTVI_106857 [Pitangus sulphuratus]